MARLGRRLPQSTGFLFALRNPNQRTISPAGGNWTSTATWVEGLVPDTTCDVVGLASSGSLTVDTATQSCRSIDLSAYVATLTITQILQIGHSTPGWGNSALKFGAGMTLAGANDIRFTATTSVQQTVTTAGKNLNSVRWQGAGGSWILTDSIASIGASFFLLAGTLDTNGQTVTCASFSTSGTPTLNAGTSAFVLSSSWQWGGGTFNRGTSSITVSTNSTTFTGGGQTYYNVTLKVASGGTVGIVGANTFNNLTLAMNTAIFNQNNAVTLGANQIVQGAVNADFGTGITGTYGRVLIASDVLGTTRTLTAATMGTVQYVDFRDIAFAGAATWDTSASDFVGDCGGNSGMTFPAAVTRYAVVAGSFTATSMWATTSGGAGGARVPLPQDTAVFDSASAAGTYSLNMARVGTIQEVAGFTRTLSLAATTVHGSYTLVAGSLYSANGATITLGGRGNYTLTTAGKSLAGVTVAAPGGTYTLGDPLTSTGTLTLSTGTFDANNNNVSVGLLVSNVTTFARTLTMGSGTWSITAATGNIVNLQAVNLTLNAGASTVAVTDAGASNKFFIVGTGKALNIVTITAGGTGQILFQTDPAGTMTFGTLNVTGPKSINFTAGATWNITNWNVNGTSGNLVTVTSGTSGSAATLRFPTLAASSDYLSVKDIAAQTNTLYAGANSTNVSGNTNVVFTVAPPLSTVPLASTAIATGTMTLTTGGGGASAQDVPLAAATAVATGSLALAATTAIPLSTSSATGSGTMAVTAPTIVGLSGGAATATGALALRAPTLFTLAGSGVGSGALALRAPTLFTLAGAAVGSTTLALTAPALLTFTGAGVGTGTLALTAPTRFTLSGSASAAGALSLTAPTGLTLSSSGAGAGALALAAPVNFALAASSSSTGSISVTAPTSAILSPGSATAIGTMALTVPTAVALVTASATGTGTATLTTTNVPAFTFTSSGAGTGNLALTAPSSITMSASGAGSASLSLTAAPQFTFTGASTGSASLTLSAPSRFTLTGSATATGSAQLTAATSLTLSGSATSDASVALTAALPVSFSSAGSATGSLALRAPSTIAATGVGRSDASLALTAASVLTLVATASASASLAATVAEPLTLSATGISSATLELLAGLGHPIVGALTAVAFMQAALDAHILIPATLDASVLMTGDLVAQRSYA